MEAEDVVVNRYFVRQRNQTNLEEDSSDEDCCVNDVEDDSHESDEQDCNEFTTDTDDNDLPDESSKEDEDYQPPEKKSASEKKHYYLQAEKNVIYGKRRKQGFKYRWYLNPPESRGRQSSVKIHIASAKGVAKTVKEPIEAWKLLITDDMIQTIVEMTNMQMALTRDTKIKPKYAKPAAYADIKVTEMKAFLGVLYIIGMKKQNHLSLEELWDTYFG